ncbi:hypothetical protein [Thalassobaculum salexigens]|uniref:hypothetical protein n=1 Tax=Thalassobaculum salexigens TaxID=455360 RepID=UPI000425E7CB|nr:hypothetical protein [Thalassobaculum salexigens]
MDLMRHAIVIGCLAALTGCGSFAVFETEQQRQARIEAAVQQALERERGRQTHLVDRRIEPVLDSQRTRDERLDGLERMTAAIADRLQALERSGPGASAYPDADEPARQAEVDSLQHDVTALAAAVSRISGGDTDGEAVLRARLERLELRTSRIAWPPPSSAVRAVHLASYRSHEAALAGWEVLLSRYRDILGDETPTLVEVRTVAGEYVRLFAGVGRDQQGLLRIREALRDGGDYAMILPLPGNAGS